MKTLISSLFLFFNLLLFVNCQKQSKESVADSKNFNVLSEEKLIDILADIHLAEALHQTQRYNKADTSLKILSLPDYYEEIFHIHQCTAQDFEQAFDFYTQHPDKFEQMYEKIISQLKELKVEETPKKLKR